MSENIKVAVRVRPFLPNEEAVSCVAVRENHITIGEGRTFAFDTVFDMNATSDDVYVALGQSVADAFLGGFNASTIAYGQTGAGKTFTMATLSSDVIQEVFCRLLEESDLLSGSITAEGATVATPKAPPFAMRVSALEVYNEHLGDLLGGKESKYGVLVNNNNNGADTANGGGGGGNGTPGPSSASTAATGGGSKADRRASVGPNAQAGGSGPSSSLMNPTAASAAAGSPSSSANAGASSSVGGGGNPPSLQLREDPKGGVYVPGLSEYEVHSADSLQALVDKATANRKTASTLMNATSSRSHCVVTLTMQHKGLLSKCCFVDLAGSERMKKSLGIGAGEGGTVAAAAAVFNTPDGGNQVMERMKEGISINGGLLALGNVIVALCEKKPYVPFRSSKLTRLLQPMLGGNSKTAMVACVSPVSSSFEESLNTLKYADRAKSIRTNPHLVVASFNSQDEAERTILALRSELAEVQRQLSMMSAIGNGVNGPMMSPKQAAAMAAAMSSAAGDATSSVAVLSAQIAELQVELSKEQQVSKQLEEDLFSAEYTAMIEVEKRKALEERLLEVEGCSPRTEDGDSCGTSQRQEDANTSASAYGGGGRGGAAEDSPRTRLTTNLALLKKLEEERDSLKALKASKEADTERLQAALISGGDAAEGGEGLSGGAEGSDHAEAHNGEDGSTAAESAASAAVQDTALTELSQEIEHKQRLIEQLERQNDEAIRQLAEYERELVVVGDAKGKLEEELAKAEALLEKSEMARQKKEAEKARLYDEYAQRLRLAEEKASDFRRRVQEAEQEIRTRAASIEQMRQLQQQVEQLREEVAKQRATKREEQKKANQKSVAHTQQVHKLQRQLTEAELQAEKLQAQLAKKDKEIAKAKAQLSASEASVMAGAVSGRGLGVGGGAGAATANTTSTAVGGKKATAYRRSPRAPRSPGGSLRKATSIASAGVSREARLQAQIDDELKSLEQLERELSDLQNYRVILLQACTGDAPKWTRAIKGFTKRLHTIQRQLDESEDASNASTVLTDAQRASLETEKNDIEQKLVQLESFQRLFDEAKLQLEEFDTRIDSLNEARKYHLQRVRRLQEQREHGDAGGDASLNATATAAGTEGGKGADTFGGTRTFSGTRASLPSVSEIANSRTRVLTRRRTRRGLGAATAAAGSTTPTITSNGAMGGGEVSENDAPQQQRVAELEATVARLQNETQELRLELLAARAGGRAAAAPSE